MKHEFKEYSDTQILLQKITETFPHRNGKLILSEC